MLIDLGNGKYEAGPMDSIRILRRPVEGSEGTATFHAAFFEEDGGEYDEVPIRERSWLRLRLKLWNREGTDTLEAAQAEAAQMRESIKIPDDNVFVEGVEEWDGKSPFTIVSSNWLVDRSDEPTPEPTPRATRGHDLREGDDLDGSRVHLDPAQQFNMQLDEGAVFLGLEVEEIEREGEKLRIRIRDPRTKRFAEARLGVEKTEIPGAAEKVVVQIAEALGVLPEEEDDGDPASRP